MVIRQIGSVNYHYCEDRGGVSYLVTGLWEESCATVGYQTSGASGIFQHVDSDESIQPVVGSHAQRTRPRFSLDILTLIICTI